MSHPLRVRIPALLDERPASPVELSGWLGSTLGTTAYHVRTLERLGLIELVAESRVRGAVEHHYRARERPSVSDEAWAAAPAIAKQAAVSASLETIDAYAKAASEAGGFDDGDAHLTRRDCTSTPAASRTSPKPACGSSPSSTASKRTRRSASSGIPIRERPRTSRS